jgi:hypothetical protein
MKHRPELKGTKKGFKAIFKAKKALNELRKKNGVPVFSPFDIYQEGVLSLLKKEIRIIPALKPEDTP